MARSRIYPPSVQPGKPRLGTAPEGWTTYRFADVFQVIERPAKIQDDTEYQLITAKRSRGGVVARERLLGKDILTKTQFYVAEDDFVISNRQIIHGGCGIVPAALDGAVVSNEYTVLRPKSVLLLDYLRYLPHTTFLQQTYFHASVGVDVEKMVFDLDQWLDFKVHLPPAREQTIIAEILTSVDETIAATQAVIDQTRTVRQGVLEHLLTKGISHTRFKQTDVGEIPETWKVVRLREVCEGMKYGTSTKCDVEPNGYPVLRIPNICGDRLDLSDLKYADVPPKEAKNFMVRDGDILAIRTNGNPNYIGKMSIVKNAPKNSLYASYLIRIRVDTRFCLPEFVHLSSQGAITRKALFDSARTSAGNYNINTKGLGDAVLTLPPITEQEKIVDEIKTLEDAIEGAQRDLRQLSIIRTVLISDLLMGRKRVPKSGSTAAE